MTVSFSSSAFLTAASAPIYRLGIHQSTKSLVDSRVGLSFSSRCTSHRRAKIFMQEQITEETTVSLNSKDTTATSQSETSHIEPRSEKLASTDPDSAEEKETLGNEKASDSDAAVAETARDEENGQTDVAEGAVAANVDDTSPLRDGQRQGRRRQRARRRVTRPFSSLEVGETVSGQVKKIMDYGAFVDIGSEKDGLLHVSRMSTGYVKNVSEICNVGDTFDVVVIQLDKEKGNFSLATVESAQSRREGARSAHSKESTDAKWAEFQFDKEAFIDGTVKHITDFGAFVDIGGPADGLVHVSQIPRGTSKDSLSTGDSIKVRVASVDKKRNRIGLSMKEFVPDSAAISEQVRISSENQPEFKTSFQLAWEKATAVKEAKEQG